jgi:hypothetical protein
MGVRQRGIKFEARIQHQGKEVYLGMFRTCEKAEAAVIKAKQDIKKLMGD